MKAKENPEEMIRDNEKNFIEGPTASVDGSFKHLSREQILEVHRQIDLRMEELEVTGLTRNEILYDDPNSGVPLKDDPFY